MARSLRTFLRTLAACMAALPVPGAAAELPFAGAALGEVALESMRGGYVSDSGLKIAIGIDRAVLINDTFIDTGSIRIADLSALAARAPGAVQTRGSPLNLVQNGPGNFAEPALLSQFGPGMLTLVQNSLDGQLIQGRTVMTIDISGASTLGMREAISALNFQLHRSR